MITVGTDSYVSLVEAEDYFSKILNSEKWDAETDIRKEKALKNATMNIDKLLFIGRKVDSEQPLQFPRYVEYIKKYVFDNTGIPEDIKKAVCEEALFLLSGGSKRLELQAEGVKSFSLGDLSENFAENNKVYPVCPKAIAHLKKYILGSVAIC